MGLVFSHADNKISATPVLGNSAVVIDNLALAFIDIAQSTAAPNATVPVSSIAAKGVATDIDFVIAPKGTGAIALQVSDGTTANGNKRGASAVDLQFTRTGATRVAAGANSCAIGGTNNGPSGAQSATVGGSSCLAGGTNSFVGGGSNGQAAGAQAFVGGGTSCTATQTGAAAIGGASNTAIATLSAIAGGQSNVASAGNSFVGGGQSNNSNGTNSAVVAGHTCASSGIQSLASGQQANARTLIAARVHSAGAFAAVGDAQYGRYIARGITANATPLALTFNAGAVGTTNQVVIGNNSAVNFRVQCVAHRTDVAGEYCAINIEGLMTRGANAASTAILAAAKTTLFKSVDGWDFNVAADVTNGGLSITFTGEAGKTVRAVATISTTEVTS